MLKNLDIKSHKGLYTVAVTPDAFKDLASLDPSLIQLIVDENVFGLYQNQFKQLDKFKQVLITAHEDNKNIDKMSEYTAQLMENGIKINHTLVAVGGGIIQDITCFLASTLFRGLNWSFVPTTLLAQADSCIGSKSSINVGEFKNLMGTFTPPQKIYLDVNFLNTLAKVDIASGIGEILKVHMIKSIEQFEKAVGSIEKMKTDRSVLLEFIYQSLVFKRDMIELDEFDKGPRNVMNYGHTYGHALESATDFAVPHGIAVTIGMDMANHQSYKMNRITKDQFSTWHNGLKSNYAQYSSTKVNRDIFYSAIRKDKKNIGSTVALILPRNQGPIEKVHVAPDKSFVDNCTDFFENYLRN